MSGHIVVSHLLYGGLVVGILLGTELLPLRLPLGLCFLIHSYDIVLSLTSTPKSERATGSQSFEGRRS